ncbi:DNA/RNA nuclease SfsA [Insolitispirillum peregrinum]|uniref:Sugar fermentation stimulation protein homolog n=1 Tax=Insolitispirillum peregrinum TaxID=80876 RepID=A0A1N7LLQ5_9PROT|nr:DNA/RNA nuclease SfsA [Insolitispirillum peregrinum]SIS74770.1 sugar fermentation stimulation protein A [Insolitispirillum peregrinum]
MDFSAPLLKGTLIKRYKRFLADVTLDDGSVVTAHTANSGSMLGCCTPGSEVWLSPANNPERKLKFTWELVRVGDELVGINTSHPNALAAEAILSGAIPELAGYATLKREVKYGKNSRIDVFLTAPDRPDCYVEVKNTTLFRPDGDNQQVALFPDAVTERGTKHLGELSEMVRAGKRAVMLYMVQRSAAGLSRFAVAEDIDPTYAAALRDALAVGVEALCYTCSVTPERLEVATPLPIRL